MTGSGTAADPYKIYDVNDLQAMNDDLTAYYELANDIDASATSGWNGGLGFAPIGPSYANAFTGQFDGKNFCIDSLTIARPATSTIGLFGEAFNVVTIQNVGLTNVNISGLHGTGALIGLIRGTIISCYSTGTVQGENRCGGLVGSSQVGEVLSSYSTCTVMGTSYASVGG
ncbi:unnamed protein product, partial [marine sediment metagenome]